MKLLIAGFGDLGRHIARQCATHPKSASIPDPSSEVQIVALRRHPAAISPQSNLQTIAADLTQPQTLELLPNDITHVVFCPTSDAFTAQGYRQTFVTGLQNLCAQLKTQSQHPRVLMVSSSAVYRQDIAGWVDETTPTEPDRFNGQVLLEAEQWLQSEYDPSAVVLRLSGLYGPGRDRALKSLTAQRIILPKETGYWVNRIHIADAARACLHLLKLNQRQNTQQPIHNQNSIFIGTDDQPLDAHVFYDALAQQLGIDPPARADDPSRDTPGIQKRRLSNARLKHTGFAFQWPNALDGYQTLIHSA